MSQSKTWGHLDPASDRADTWRAIYGGLDVPLESPLPVLADSPAGRTLFYKVDVARLPADQLERAIDHVADVFGYSRGEVEAGIRGAEGLPILAEGVTVTFEGRLV